MLFSQQRSYNFIYTVEQDYSNDKQNHKALAQLVALVDDLQAGMTHNYALVFGMCLAVFTDYWIAANDKKMGS